jgi:hypothetical protein
MKDTPVIVASHSSINALEPALPPSVSHFQKKKVSSTVSFYFGISAICVKSSNVSRTCTKLEQF